MIILTQVIITVIIFLLVNFGAHWLTEVKGLPDWLNYKPFSCDLCLTFWSLIGIYITLWLSFSCLYIGIYGITLAILNAIAMWIDQRQKTITLDDWEDLNDKTK